MTTVRLDNAIRAFASELSTWRARRGLSRKQLAHAMGFDPSYVSHVECARHRPTKEFARRAEAVLESGERIWQRFVDLDRLRQGAGSRVDLRHVEPIVAPGTTLVVENEVAELWYRNNWYRCSVRRRIRNYGTTPVVQYPIRVDVDLFPDDPHRSREFYRANPLTFDELRFSATLGSSPEPIDWRVKHDRDAFKKIILLFSNDSASFPLYPNQSTELGYDYYVPAEKYGHWFQREIRLPTRALSIRLAFPADTPVTLWGRETSYESDGPISEPPLSQGEGDHVVFKWEKINPPLSAQYRLQWRTDDAAA